MKCLPPFETYRKHLDIFGRSLKKVLIILPSRELTYIHTCGKRKIIFKKGYVSSLEGSCRSIYISILETKITPTIVGEKLFSIVEVPQSPQMITESQTFFKKRRQLNRRREIAPKYFSLQVSASPSQDLSYYSLVCSQVLELRSSRFAHRVFLKKVYHVSRAEAVKRIQRCMVMW